MANEKTKTLPHHEKLVFLWNSVRSIVSDLDVDDSKLTEEHEIRIKRYYDQLLSNLNVPDVATHMFKIGKLSARDHEHLRQFQSTPIKASEELLNIIITNTRDVYECFLESLKRTKQHHVYQMLISEEDDMCMDELSVSEHSRLIRLNYDWLTESLDPDSGLLSTLYAKEVLNKREYAQIFCEKDRFIKNEGLLSAISRKTVEDFNKFIVALNATLQGHITKKLFKKPTGETFQVVVTTKMKTMPTACFHEFEKRIPPRPPPKPKKQTPALPSIEPVVIKPLLKPKINQSQPNLTEKQQWRKQSAQYLGAKLKALPNELQTEVSTKIFLIHQRESTDSLWKITFTKILEDSRNIRTQFLMYAKAADEKCERLMQEINRREREYQVIKEDIKREKINSKAHLRQVQGAVNELEGRLNLTENENRNLLVKLKKSEIEGERLKALNKRKEQEANVQTIVGGEHQGQIAYSEMEALLKDARKSLIEKDHALTRTTKQLKETQEMLKETKVKLDELKALLMVREKRIDNLEVLNQRKEQKVNEYLCIIEKLEDHIAHSERKLQEAEAQLKDTNYKLMEKDISLRETSAKFEDFQKQLNVPHTDRDSLKSEDYSRAEATFRYTVNNISKLKDGILSPPFYVRNLPWKIMAMLKTSVKTPQNHSQKNFGFFLQCNGESDSKTWSCNGAAELKILNQKPDGKPVIRKIKHLFFSKESDWGFSNFIPMSELLDPKNDYVKDDSVTLEVYVKADAPHGVNWDFKHHKALFGLKDEGAT